MWQLFGAALGVMFGMIGLALALLVIGMIAGRVARLRRRGRHECPQCHAFRGELWEVLAHQGEEHDYS